LTLSSDTGNRKEAEKVLAKWSGKGAGILVATERVLPFLPDFIPCITIASVDTYLGIPEYSASEGACALLCELRARSEGTFVLQSRNLEHRAMRTIREGILSTFYKDELRDREKYGYPPFSTVVRFSFQGKAEMVRAKVAEYLRALASLSPIELAGQSPRKGHMRIHIVLRLPADTWVNQKLLRFIRALPPNIEVRVNPRNIHTG
jgi:primosomal protein N' (replication factor Y)